MNELELLKFYDAKEKALIESLGEDIEYLRQHMQQVEQFANPTAQEARRQHVNENRKQMREAAERRIILAALIEKLSK